VPRFFRSSLPFALLIPCFTVAAHAQRLPTNVRPEHYTLSLTPDLKTATFTGKETIDVALAQPATTITLNAAQIKFDTVTADVDGTTMTPQVSEDESKEQATFTFAKTLPAGHVALHIAYEGILNGQLRGFYLSKTARRNYAVTQFEPTDARRAFPSFDEPAMKATFTVSLTINKGDTAISNTNIVSDTPGPGEDKHTLKFATTPKMSTYLVAFLVGDFECTTGASEGVPIRVCATPDKVQYTGYALKAAEFVLHYYDTYFGIKYPMPKLDLIAIPDFEAGAMENFGAITYRETDLLLDEKHASLAAKERVAQVVAHEMAHQWFGDMVTMQWWNNIWLNEGFADWMENKPVAAWHPEWHIPEQVAEELNSTLDLDAQAVTRTIEARADTPDEINEMFDGITYQKGASVIHMIESYLGPENFRKGVHQYLEAHMFANATAEDFWNAETASSGKPVNKIMPTFIQQPGEPLLTFAEPQAGKVLVTQRRFYLNPKLQSPTEQTWTIPVCIRTALQPQETAAGTAGCPLLTSAQQELPVNSWSGSGILYGNAGASGYYRSAYAAPLIDSLIKHAEDGLSPRERILLVGDVWAQVRNAKQSVGTSLQLDTVLKSDPSSDVLETELQGLSTISARLLATPEEHAAFEHWIVKTYKPQLTAIADPKPGDTPETEWRRAELYDIVGELGKDSQTIEHLKQMADRYLADQDSVDPNMVPVALDVAARNGDAALFDKLQHVFETNNDPQRAEQALGLLSRFENPELTRRALEYAASGKVKNQDSLFIFAGALANPNTHDVAWQWITHHWPAVQAQLTEMNGARVVSATSSFCSAEKAQEVKTFFTEHPIHAAARAVGIAQSHINDCVEFRGEQEANLKNWLATQQ
jgi:aminopeptidase N/puromycin-sensitive aminopeptidase